MIVYSSEVCKQHHAGVTQRRRRTRQFETSCAEIPQGNKSEIAKWKDKRYQLKATKAYPFIAILVDSEYLKRNRKEKKFYSIKMSSNAALLLKGGKRVRALKTTHQLKLLTPHRHRVCEGSSPIRKNLLKVSA